MKVIIAGSRNIIWPSLIYETILWSGFAGKITEVVSGKAAGVDSIGEVWALEHGIPIKEFPADWSRFGKRAGHIRNAQMGDYSDALIAIWDGESRGTANMIDYMQKLNKPVYVRNLKGDIKQFIAIQQRDTIDGSWPQGSGSTLDRFL
jgi:hypothetical protein